MFRNNAKIIVMILLFIGICALSWDSWIARVLCMAFIIFFGFLMRSDREGGFIFYGLMGLFMTVFCALSFTADLILHPIAAIRCILSFLSAIIFKIVHMILFFIYNIYTNFTVLIMLPLTIGYFCNRLIHGILWIPAFVVLTTIIGLGLAHLTIKPKLERPLYRKLLKLHLVYGWLKYQMIVNYRLVKGQSPWQAKFGVESPSDYYFRMFEKKVVRENNSNGSSNYQYEKNKNLLDILELDHYPTKVELKSAMRKLSKKYHPDCADGDADKFRLVQEAYETLVKVI